MGWNGTIIKGTGGGGGSSAFIHSRREHISKSSTFPSSQQHSLYVTAAHIKTHRAINKNNYTIAIQHLWTEEEMKPLSHLTQQSIQDSNFHIYFDNITSIKLTFDSAKKKRNWTAQLYAAHLQMKYSVHSPQSCKWNNQQIVECEVCALK